MAAFFFLLAFILYLKRVEKSAKGTAYYLSLLFFFCGLLSKEMAITLPAVILLHDLTFGALDGQALSVKGVLKTVKKRWAVYLG